MRKQSLLSIIFLMGATMLVVQPNSLAQAPAQAATAKPMKKDEVYFSIGRRLNALNDSPVSAIVTELDGVIEVTGITIRPDGKAEVTVKEIAPSSAAYTNKSTRLLFAPPAAGDKQEKWTWEQFEENRRFYAVDKLFPYAKDELGKRRQLTVASWNAFLGAINKQGEAAAKSLETAKAILKGDPPPLAALVNARKALAEAMKENKTDEILDAYRQLQQQTDAVATLGDSYSDLKANDAYLRLLEEFKNSVNVTNAARKSYVQTVAAYNEALLRLPFGLVAYGLQFLKIEANISE
jgi:LemA protein